MRKSGKAERKKEKRNEGKTESTAVSLTLSRWAKNVRQLTWGNIRGCFETAPLCSSG